MNEKHNKPLKEDSVLPEWAERDISIGLSWSLKAAVLAVVPSCLSLSRRGAVVQFIGLHSVFKL